MADDGNPISDAVELVKAYAMQETVDPLKHLSTFFKWGIIGAVFVMFGSLFLVLGALRSLQALDSTFFSWDWIEYIIAIVVAAAITGLTGLVIFRSK